MFNLIVLIGGTYQIRLSGGSQTALVYTSVSVAFAAFIGIVISGIVWQVTKVWMKVYERCQAAREETINRAHSSTVKLKEPLQPTAAGRPSTVTYSVV